MSHYGISAIHWNANLGEIDEVQLHKIVRQDHKDTYAVSHSVPTWCSDVISLIHGGATVWVMVSVAPPGSYKNTEYVRINVRRGGQEYLYSCTKDGTPTSTLTDLPRYQKPDDLSTPDVRR